MPSGLSDDELQAQTDGELECIICLSDMEPQEELVRLPCSEAEGAKAHVFHSDCLGRWLLSPGRARAGQGVCVLLWENSPQLGC